MMDNFAIIFLQIFEGTDLLSKALPAVFGALIGSYLTRLLNRNREKVTLIFELHKEFNSYEMNIHRRKADKLLKKFPSMSYDELGSLTDEEVSSAFVILRFFQRLSQSVKYKQVKKKIVLDLFTEAFYHWYYISYEKNLVPLDWEASDQMLYLSEWLKKKTKIEKHLRLKTEMTEKLLLRIG